jgi:hypothetical protein
MGSQQTAVKAFCDLRRRGYASHPDLKLPGCKDRARQAGCEGERRTGGRWVRRWHDKILQVGVNGCWQDDLWCPLLMLTCTVARNHKCSILIIVVLGRCDWTMWYASTMRLDDAKCMASRFVFFVDGNNKNYDDHYLTPLWQSKISLKTVLYLISACSGRRCVP